MSETPFGPGNPRPYLDPTGLSPETLAVRGGQARSTFDATSEGLYLTSGFVYGSAEEAEASFTQEVEKFVYSRYGNPTVAMFEERLRVLEGADAALGVAQPGPEGGVVPRRLVEGEGQTLDVGIHPLDRGLHVRQAAIHDAHPALQGDDLGIGLDQHRLAGGVALRHGALEAADVAVQLFEAAAVPLDRLQRGGLGDDVGAAADEGDAEGGGQDLPGAQGGGELQHGRCGPTDLRPPQGVRRPDPAR